MITFIILIEVVLFFKLFFFLFLVLLLWLEYFICIRDYLLVIFHVLYFVINKGCRVSHTMSGLLSFVDVDNLIIYY